MQYQDNQESFSQIIKVFKTRKLVIFLCILAVISPVIYFNNSVAPTYEASISLVFEDFISPTQNFASESSMDFILDRIEEIKSRSFTEDIINIVDVETINKIQLPEEIDEDFDKNDFIVSQVHDNISAFLLHNSNIIMITVQQQDPELCMKIANAAAEVLKERCYKVKKAGRSNIRKFVEGQLAKVNAKLDESENALRRFKEENKIMSYNMESEEIQRKLTQAEILYNEAQSDKGAAEERLTIIEKKFSTQKEELVPSITMVSNPRVQNLKEKLIQIELQYLDLKVQNYSPNHPKMVQLNQEIKNTRESLKQETLKLVDENKLIDPIAQMEKYAGEAINLELDLESLKARETALKGIINQYDNSLRTLPGKEYELVRLTREREVNHKIYMMLSEKLQEAKISEAENITEIRIIDEAEMPKLPIKPNKKLNLAIGLIIGLIVGTGLAYLLEYKKIMIASPEEVEEVVKWPLLGVIPNIDIESNAKLRLLKKSHPNLPKGSFAQRGLISSLEPKSGAAEAYRMLRTNLIFKGTKKDHKTLLVTSVSPSNGKSTTATNLAISFAALSKKTLLIDADFRMSKLHSLFGFDREPGLTDILDNANSFREKFTNVLKQNVRFDFERKKLHANLLKDQFVENDLKDEYDFIIEKMEKIKLLNKTAIRKTDIENLSFISSGKLITNPSENVSTRTIKLILEELKNKFDIVIIDSPPIALVPDTMLLSTLVDETVFIVDVNQYDKEMLLRAKNLSENAAATVVGIVVNNIKNKEAYQKYHYYYGEQEAA